MNSDLFTPDFFKGVAVALVGACLGVALSSCEQRGARDDTDGAERSGMSLFTDRGTGCQYLAARYSGGITPRLDAQGKHVCKEQPR